MQDVADNRDFQSVELAFVFTNREGVEQGLRWMFVRAIAGVNDWRVSHLCEMLRRAGHRMTNADAIWRHRFEISRRVEQRFAFRDAGSRNTDVHGVSRQAF